MHLFPIDTEVIIVKSPRNNITTPSVGCIGKIVRCNKSEEYPYQVRFETGASNSFMSDEVEPTSKRYKMMASLIEEV